MKKQIITVTLLLILTSSSAQTSETLGISEGDTFDFVLEKFLFQLGSETKTTAEFEDDFTSDQSLILHIGETFTIKILDTSPEGSYDDSAILVEYIASGNSITMYDYVGFGDFFSYTNWDEIKQDNGEIPPHINYTLLDTASEFGFVWEYSSTYSDSTLSETEFGVLEVRYDRTTGAINYYYNLHNEVEVYDDGSLAFLGEVFVKRVGYEDDNSDASPAQGFQFLAFPSIFTLTIIRKKARFN